ncbi:MAG TPA: PIG-L family deacetylase [Casimicrobiaceae bacterium]|nr:PIG-L family deacetylase [Casimicrobiaceae bacterium]
MKNTGARLFVSPHLDDAVFGCGQLIASSPGALVVTLFAGDAPKGVSPTRWDRECGFDEGDDVVTRRRDEDRCALALLAARPVWLDFRDDQYGESAPVDVIADALARVIEHEKPDIVHSPLGLFHSDHYRASDASLALVDRFASLEWRLYEDAIYRRIPGAVEARLDGLRERGFRFERDSPAFDAGAGTSKREAVACYASQLRALATRAANDDVFAPEAHWVVYREHRR